MRGKMLLKLYCAENIKHRRTFAGRIWILMPVLTLVLAYGISQANGLNSAYNWWYTLMMPGMITLFCCLAGEKDRKIKNRAILTLPVEMRKVWDAKILSGVKTLLLSNFFSGAANLILGMYLAPRFWVPQVLDIGPAEILAAAAVLTVTALWQIPFCLWLEQKLGMFPALIINLIMNGSGTLMAVTGYWMLNPWAILPRLMTGIIGILPNGLPAVPGSMTYTPGITDTSVILPGVAVTLIWFIVIWTLSRSWFERKGAQTV